MDLPEAATVAAAATWLAGQGPFQVIINAAGLLHGPDLMPRKKLGDLSLARMRQAVAVNTSGPALLLRHFAPLLDRRCGRMAILSAKVGSIGHKRLGGWYSGRASKAALNMLVQTASIRRDASPAANALLGVIDRASAPDDTGGFFSDAGGQLPPVTRDVTGIGWAGRSRRPPGGGHVQPNLLARREVVDASRGDVPRLER